MNKAILNITSLTIAILAAVVIFFALPPRARAEEPKRPSYEELQEQVSYWRAVAQGAIQQRDAANAALSNQALETAAQAAMKAEKAKK